MDVIIMPSTTSLIQKLKQEYPRFRFKKSTQFLWSPSEKTVYYTASDTAYELLLHELSHGILGHTAYLRDIELIAMERAAWDLATTLAVSNKLSIDESLIESTLDSYRDWLHARSTCPVCTATGQQVKKFIYHCPACQHSWKVNEARVCNLRRTTIKPN